MCIGMVTMVTPTLIMVIIQDTADCNSIPPECTENILLNNT